MTPRTALVGLASAATVGLAWASLVERQWYALRHVTVPVLRSAPPLRVLHLSDLHLLPGQDRRVAFVRSCLATGPDLVVVTGDLLEADAAIDPAVELMADLARDRPTLAVLGSHDRWVSTGRNPLRYLRGPCAEHVHGPALDTARLVRGLADGGVELVDNRRTTVETAAGIVDVAGLADPHVGLDRPDAIDWSAPTEAVTLRLALVHAPYRAPLTRFADAGFDLAMAGHTHGGQVRLPGVGALVNNCDLPLAASRGLSRPDGRMWLHVSAGLGHSRYAPVRLCCRPEASVVDLVAAA